MTTKAESGANQNVVSLSLSLSEESNPLERGNRKVRKSLTFCVRNNGVNDDDYSPLSL